jgi:2-methylcitrate dehydratase PrpD
LLSSGGAKRIAGKFERSKSVARFVAQTRFSTLSEETNKEFKVRVFDSLHCAIGALDSKPGRMLRAQTSAFDDAKK